jgi:hypothetical protein
MPDRVGGGGLPPKVTFYSGPDYASIREVIQTGRG